MLSQGSVGKQRGRLISVFHDSCSEARVRLQADVPEVPRSAQDLEPSQEWGQHVAGESPGVQGVPKLLQHTVPFLGLEFHGDLIDSSSTTVSQPRTW